MDSVRTAIDSTAQILRQPMNYDHLVQLIIAMTALVAVIISPLIQIFITRYQAEKQFQIHRETLENAQKISLLENKIRFINEKRVEWIDTFRNDIADFIKYLFLAKAQEHMGSGRAEFLRMVEESSMVASRIALRLNPYEPEHIEFSKAIADAMDQMTKNDGKLGPVLPDIKRKAQILLKNEWEKVKEFN